MNKKITIGVLCVFFISLSILGGRYLYQLSHYKKIISEIVITTPDLNKIENGTYTGSFDAIKISANVSVTVDDYIITEIKINEHKNERGSSAEVITQEVIAAQSLEVDTISGATNSSKVILKAIENALNEAA